MRTRHQTTLRQLRTAIDCLPHDTKVAMLEGITSNEIVAGAYTHGDGICPMLAAHRAGGRTNFISFAKAWDRFAFRGVHEKKRRARKATERELLVLKAHLAASLLEDEGPSPQLAEAIASHKQLIARAPERTAEKARRSARPGDPDRSRELRWRPGWAWLRVMRRYDEYERALARLELEQARIPPSERETVSV
jgi:hypothetical protein